MTEHEVDALKNRVGVLDRAIAIANEYHDGHFVLMKFTTNWRFCFGTPALDHVTIADETFVGSTVEEAIEKAIKQEPLLVSGKVVRESDALLARATTVKVPKFGDTVTWLDSRAGTCLSGVVVTVRSAGVWVAIDRGGDAIGYTVVWNEDILSVTPRAVTP